MYSFICNHHQIQIIIIGEFVGTKLQIQDNYLIQAFRNQSRAQIFKFPSYNRQKIRENFLSIGCPYNATYIQRVCFGSPLTSSLTPADPRASFPNLSVYESCFHQASQLKASSHQKHSNKSTLFNRKSTLSQHND